MAYNIAAAPFTSGTSGKLPAHMCTYTHTLLNTNTQKHTFLYYISPGGELFGCKAQVLDVLDENSLENKYTHVS